jgi:DNA-binding protein H-NS
MVSNLNTAHDLIQADLDHARNVLNLWTRQVGELEKALEQIDAVGSARNAMRLEYKGTAEHTAALEAPAASNDKPKRGRKPKNAVTSSSPKPTGSSTNIAGKRGRKLAETSIPAPSPAIQAKAHKTRKTAVTKKSVATPTMKYKDPNSDKTWSGRGRRPAWFAGPSDKYAIAPQSQTASTPVQSTSEPAGSGDLAQPA